MRETVRAPSLWPPPIAVGSITAFTAAVFDRAPAAIAYWAGLAYAACLVLGPAVVYPWMRRRRFSGSAATAAALCVPVLWLAKECVAVGRVFGIAAGVYYALNPLAAGLLVAAALQMAIAELALRRVRRGRWEMVGAPAAVVAAVAALGGAYALVAWRWDATFVFWLYISGYRWLFG